jgi:hypothetical protein
LWLVGVYTTGTLCTSPLLITQHHTQYT